MCDWAERWWDFGTSVLSPVLSAGLAFLGYVWVKRCRVRADLVDIRDAIDAIGKPDGPLVHEKLETFKDHLRSIQEEAVKDSERGLRLSPRVLRKIEEIRDMADEAGKQHTGELLINILYGPQKDAAFEKSLASLRAHVEGVRKKVTVWRFLFR